MPWWFSRWRRERILRRWRPDAAAFQRALTRIRAAGHLDRDARERLRDLTGLLLHDKAIEAVRDFEFTEGMRLRIAAEACIPVLNLGLALYERWHAIIVYPAGFIAEHDEVDAAGVVHHLERPLIGEAWDRGPVLLSWDDIRHPGHDSSVIIHEMAHKLDLINGDANGHPPLHTDMDTRAWTAAFSQAFEDHRHHVERGRGEALDPYAAQSPGEFFSVASEAFFCAPEVLTRAYPQVYAQLRQYYRQDPLKAGPMLQRHGIRRWQHR